MLKAFGLRLGVTVVVGLGIPLSSAIKTKLRPNVRIQTLKLAREFREKPTLCRIPETFVSVVVSGDFPNSIVTGNGPSMVSANTPEIATSGNGPLFTTGNIGSLSHETIVSRLPQPVTGF